MCWTREKNADCGVCGGSYCPKHRGKHKCTNIQPKAIQGDLVETPAYIREHGIRINYRYYLDHQVSNPVQQIFDLIKETQNVNILKKLLIRDNNRKAGVKTITDFFK
jgi:DNA polymerase elongation subunit (family B)